VRRSIVERACRDRRMRTSSRRPRPDADRSAEKNRDFLDLRSGDSARHGGDING
jgi:hypothetical protein